jgi:SAM-dependent methyltransferase
MRRNGFSSVFGYDSFLGVDELGYGNGIDVHGTRPPRDPDGSFDIVILNHSFEHVVEPGATLAEIAALLAPDGTLFIRTPLADSYAWRTYRTNWVQLDAPRHVFIHTRASMEILATSKGLRVTDVTCDSTAWNLYASEQLRRDIPIRDPRSFASSTPASPNRESPLFTASEISEFEKRAQALNRIDEGDQALLILQHSNRRSRVGQNSLKA